MFMLMTNFHGMSVIYVVSTKYTGSLISKLSIENVTVPLGCGNILFL